MERPSSSTWTRYENGPADRRRFVLTASRFEGDEPGRQSLVGWFESDHASYRWLNDVVCIAEGTISGNGMEIHVFAGISEMPT